MSALRWETVGSVVLVSWGVGVTVADVEAVGEGIANAIAAAKPSKVRVLLVLDGGESGSAPDQAVRDAINAITQRNAHGVARMAYVYEKPGFGGALLRSVVTALQLVRPVPYPVKVFDTFSTAVDWLVEGHGVPHLLRAANRWRDGGRAA